MTDLSNRPKRRAFDGIPVSTRLFNCLVNQDYRTWDDVKVGWDNSLGELFLLRQPNWGPKTLNEFREILGPAPRLSLTEVRAGLPADVQAERDSYREALRDIAKQKKTTELETEYDVEWADFEGGYDAIIDVARAALNGGA